MTFKYVLGVSAAIGVMAAPVMTFASTLTIKNTTSTPIYMANNNPDIAKATASAGANGGTAALDSSQWVEGGGKDIYMLVTTAAGAKNDICQGSAVSKWNETVVPDEGILTVSNGAQPGSYNCSFAAVNPTSTISWSGANAKAHVSAQSGEGTLTFTEDATDSSGSPITYTAAVNGRGDIGGAIPQGGGTVTVPLKNFQGVANKSETITLAAAAADVKQPITIKVPVSVTGSSSFSTAYRQINVGEDYVGLQMPQLIDLGGYFPALPQGEKYQMSLSDVPSALQGDLTVKGGVLSLVRPVAADQFSDLSGCSPYTNVNKKVDPNIKQCSISVHDATTGVTRTVPLLINNGLRRLSSAELVDKHISHQGRVTGPDYFEVDVNGSGSDLSLNLNNYIANPSKAGVRFYADDALVSGQAAKDTDPSSGNYAAQAVVDISGIGTFARGSLVKYGFTLSPAGVLTNSGQLTPGHVYQINVAAVTGSPIEKSYVTFYIYDNAKAGSGVSFSDWKSGKVAKTNLLKTVNGNQPLTMIYTYSHADPTKDLANFYKVYMNYASDIHYAVQKYKINPAINVMTLESAGPHYTGDAPYWILDTKSTNVRQQVSNSSAISNAQGDPKKWLSIGLQSGLNPMPVSSAQRLNYSPDLTFGQAVRAEYTTYDFEQRDMLTNSIVDNYLYGDADNTKVDLLNMGINLDLEQGTSIETARTFKMMSDKLAYNGRFFGYYEFADKAFQPAVIGAMGPLGVAFISAYDVGGAGSSAARGSMSDYTNQGMNTADMNTLYQDVFYKNQSCDVGHGNPVHRYSWCNLSMTDSNAVNHIAWTTVSDSPNTYNISTKQAYDDFDGNFSITQPFAESSTDFSYQELFNPNFSTDVAKKAHNVVEAGGGLVLTNVDADYDSCSGLSNAWILSNQASMMKAIMNDNTESAREKASPAYAKLAQCLFANVSLKGNGMADPLPVTKISLCGRTPSGKPVPLSKCILLNGIPSATGDKTGMLEYPSPLGYMLDNAKPYMVNADGSSGGSLLDSHMVGYSLFALQDITAGPDTGGFYWTPAGPGNYNIAVQEPWYVGGVRLNPGDPADYHLVSAKGSFPYDPFYSSPLEKQMISSAWGGVAQLQKKFTIAGAPNS